MTVIRALIVFSCLVALSCRSKKIVTSNNCILDPTTNTISGLDIGAKEFYRKGSFIPRVLEELSFRRKKIHYHHFSYNTSEKYARYHIHGCADTTWAKQRMVEHIMQKYHVSRRDSFFLDTMFRLTIVDEAKLDKDYNCNGTIGVTTDEGAGYLEYICLRWSDVLFLPYEYDYRTHSIIMPPREGRYTIRTPIGIVDSLGLEAYSDILLEKYGVTLTREGIDTVDIGVYGYDFKP